MDLVQLWIGRYPLPYCARRFQKSSAEGYQGSDIGIAPACDRCNAVRATDIDGVRDLPGHAEKM
jgi:hypothetical protein